MLLISSSSKKKGLLSLLLWAHKVYDVWGILPYKFSKKTKQFQLKSEFQLKILRLKLRLVVLFTLLSFLQTLHIWKAITVPQLLQCWFYILFSSCGCFTLNDQLNNGQDIVALLNGMLLFERNQIQEDNFKPERPNIRKRLSKPLIRVVSFASFVIPLLGQLSFFKRPCVPIQPGFFLIAACNSLKATSLNNTHALHILPSTSVFYHHPLPVPSILTMSFLGLYILFSRALMLNSFVAQMLIGLVIKPNCLHSYVVHVMKTCKDSTATVSQLNLGCSYFNQLQLFLKNYNQAYKRSTVCVLIFIIAEAVLSLYACISLAKFLPPERRIIFGYTANNMLCCVVIIFDILADIHEESLQILEVFKVKYYKQLAEKKVNRRLVWSLTPLKIFLGSGNFVEKSTPPACQQTIIDQTVSLALLN